MWAIYLASGMVFGFLLSQIRATDYDTVIGLFWLTDWYLGGVIAVAVAVAALGFWALRRTRACAVSCGCSMELAPKPMRRGLLLGAALFGVGWALAGACPGTAIAQLGEGKIYAAATVLGILAGTYSYGWIQGRLATLHAKPPRACAVS